MTNLTKHTALFLLVIFCGSLLMRSASPATAMQLPSTAGQQEESFNKECTDKPRFVQKVSQELQISDSPDDNEDQKPEAPVFNNCQTNMLFIASSVFAWPVIPSTDLTFDRLVLLSSQMFVFQQPNPPQHV